jgi:helix-turn-helix protein
MTVPAPDVVMQLPGGYLFVGPAVVGYVSGALERVERQHRLEGIRPPEAWVHLRDAASKAADCARESAKVRKTAVMPQSPQISSGPLIGVGRVAEVLGCTPQWARTLLRRGDLTTARRVGRTWLVEEDEVVAWVLVQATQDEAAA